MRAVPPSEPSLETVYTRHSTWLRHWLKGRLQCSETAADLMQDTFMRLLNRPRVFGSDGDARGYLTTIAKGLCVDFWRRRQIEQAYLEALTHQSIPMEASPEHKAIVVETLFELDSMLCRLPTKVSNAFLLSQLKGLTYREIAEQLAVSERMVKRYMAQAMMECIRIQLTHADAMANQSLDHLEGGYEHD